MASGFLTSPNNRNGYAAVAYVSVRPINSILGRPSTSSGAGSVFQSKKADTVSVVCAFMPGKSFHVIILHRKGLFPKKSLLVGFSDLENFVSK